MLKRSYTSQEFVRLGFLFILCFLASELGSYIHAAGTAPSFIWPAAGIALGGLILWGSALWPAIALASFLQLLLNGNPLLIAIVIALANAGQALLGAYLLKQLKFHPKIERLYDTFVLVLITVLVTMVVPTIGIWIEFVSGLLPITNLSSSWGHWWSGEILSILIMTPLILRWISAPRFTWKRKELGETILAFGFLGAIDIFLFWTPYTTFVQISLIYIMLVPLFWIALRMGVRATTLALFLNAFLVLVGTAVGFPATHAVAALGTRLLQSEIFLIIISLIFLILASIAEERKNAADALRDHVEQLEKAVARISIEDTAKSEFIATLAHELRNPLAPLVSSLDILRMGSLSAIDQEELVEVMGRSIAMIRHLLDDLLDISRISRQKFKIEKEVVDLSEIIMRSVRMVEPLMQERDHTFTLNLPPETINLNVDPVRFEQILLNLLNNAAKYTEPGGTIKLEVKIIPGTITMRICDSGIGIESSLLKHIFDPFMQIERGNRKRTAGLGIGLSLARTLVELHGGTIEAQSAGPGQGSEFIVRLRYSDPQENLIQTAIIAKNPVSSFFSSIMGPHFKILVVDDNQAAAKALQKLLTLRGHTVETAFGANEALVSENEFKPRVILLDIGLPEMDGYEVARQLREVHLFSGTIIALTGYGQEEDKQKADGAGCDYHLTKPAGLVDIEEILKQIS
ncbi:MASE1 domain-containing protein [Patescibacteria group bacterium]|nr:MASE1 domain-containing protein [Patescibacteria group bacterium]